jgi:hypothetical protein
MSLNTRQSINLDINRLLNHVLTQSILDQSLHTFRVFLILRSSRASDMHGSVRAQPIVDREVVVLRVSARDRGQDVFVTRAADAVLVSDGEGVDVGLELDGQAAEGRDGGGDDAEVQHYPGK